MHGTTQTIMPTKDNKRRQVLSDAQRTRMRSTYRDAGPEAVAGFRKVLEAMMDAKHNRKYMSLREGK